MPRPRQDNASPPPQGFVCSTTECPCDRETSFHDRGSKHKPSHQVDTPCPSDHHRFKSGQSKSSPSMVPRALWTSPLPTRPSNEHHLTVSTASNSEPTIPTPSATSSSLTLPICPTMSESNQEIQTVHVLISSRAPALSMFDALLGPQTDSHVEAHGQSALWETPSTANTLSLSCGRSAEPWADLLSSMWVTVMDP